MLDSTCGGAENVEYKRIGDVCRVITGGEPPVDSQKNQDDKHPYAIWGNGKDVYGYSGSYEVEEAATVISSIGANTGAVYFKEGHFTPIIRLKVIVPNDNSLNARFLYYALSSQKIESKSSSVPNMNANEIKRLQIPVPPLSVQEEIVSILDKFNTLTTDITTGLPAEISLRQKQYEHYRDRFLNFNGGGYELEDKMNYARSYKLGEIIDFKNGFAFKSSLFKKNGIGVLRISNIKLQRIDTDDLVYIDPSDYQENLESYVVEPGDILVAMSGATTGKVGINDTSNQYYLNQRVGKFVPRNDRVDVRYLFHLLVMNSPVFYAISGGGAQPNLSSEKLRQLNVFLPPIIDQKKIGEILDKLDKLINDLSVGLPAEIEARKKQYEYYRDTLLSFKRKQE